MNFSGKKHRLFPIRPCFRVLFIASFSLFFSCLFLQAAEPPVPPSADWSLLFRGRPGNDPCAAYSVVLVDEEAPFGNDDHYVVAGSQSLFIWDPYHPPVSLGHWSALAKLDLGGTLVDSEIFDTEGDHNGAYAIIPSYTDSNVIDGYAVTGFRHSFFEEDGHEYHLPWTWLMKVGTDLEKVWDRTWNPALDSPFTDWGNSLIQVGTGDDKGFVIGGQKNIGPVIDFAGYMIRSDNGGTLEWAIDGYMHDGGVPRYPWIGSDTEIHSIKETSEGDYILGTSSGIIKTNAVVDNPPTHAWTVGEGSYASVKQTADGGYIGVGHKLVTVPGADDRYDVVLTKLDASGAEIWSRTFGRLTEGLGSSGLDDYGRDVIQTADGGYALVGTTRSYAWHGGQDMWLIKTDDDGVMEWDLVLGDSGNDGGHALVEAPDHGLVLAGYITWEGASRMWILKIRPGSFTVPVPAFSTTPPSPFFVEETVEFDASASTAPGPGGEIVTYEWDFGDGQTGSGVIDHHAYIQPITYTATLYVTDNQGIRRDVSQDLTANSLLLQWERFYGQGGDHGRDIVTTPDGGFVIAGSWMVTHGNVDLWVFKTDGRGNVVWDRKHDNEDYPSMGAGAAAVTPAVDGGYVLAGHREVFVDNPDIANTESDVWILKVDEDTGDAVWGNYFDSSVHERANDITPVPAPDNGYILCGYTTRQAGEDSRKDLWLIKTTYDGNEGREVMDWDSAIPGLDPNNEGLEGYAVIPTADGGYVVTGELLHFPSYPFVSRPILTVKTDSTGTVIWRAATFPLADRNVGGRWVCQTPDSGYMVAARHDFACALQKLSPIGSQQSLTKWGYENAAFPVSATKTPDSGFAIVGHYYIDWQQDYNYDVFITRTDSEGEFAWEFNYPIVGENENARQILSLSDGSFVVLASRPDQTESTWLFKFGPNNPPAGNFTFAPDPPMAGWAVEFTATASDSDGTVESYEWQFGDGTDLESTSNPIIFHTFVDPGVYTVTLTIVDNAGGERMVTNDITVIEGTLPGDLDNDGDLDGADLATFADAYGAVEGVDPNYNPDADLNDDGVVDEADLEIFAETLGAGGS